MKWSMIRHWEKLVVGVFKRCGCVSGRNVAATGVRVRGLGLWFHEKKFGGASRGQAALRGGCEGRRRGEVVLASAWADKLPECIAAARRAFDIGEFPGSLPKRSTKVVEATTV